MGSTQECGMSKLLSSSSLPCWGGGAGQKLGQSLCLAPSHLPHPSPKVRPGWRVSSPRGPRSQGRSDPARGDSRQGGRGAACPWGLGRPAPPWLGSSTPALHGPLPSVVSGTSVAMALG